MPMEINLQLALKTLREGGTILYPTDTVWGIGCDATNDKAVEKVYNIKKRPNDKTFLILLDDAKKLENYVQRIPSITYDIIESATSPLTIVYPNAKNIAKNLISDGTIGIRIVNDVFCKKLIKLFGKPIVSTSANFHKVKSPVIYCKIDAEIINAVDYVVTLNQNKIIQLKQSTIIKIQENGEFEVIRK